MCIRDRIGAIQAAASGAHLIITSSVATYGDTTGSMPPIRVSHAQKPVDIYGESKVAAEKAILESDVPYTILRVSGISVPALLDPPETWPFMHDQRMEFINRADVIDMLNQTPIERFLEAMAAGLDGPAAEGKSLKVNLVLTDIKDSYGLWIENSVLHFKRAEPAADANATLTLTKTIFVKMIAGTAGVKDTLLSDDLKIGGSKIDLVRFFGLIEKAPGTFAIVTR